MRVVYQHRIADRAAVAVTDGGLSALCMAGPEGFFSTSYDFGEVPQPLREYLRAPDLPAPDLPGQGLTHLLAGEVADGIEQVDIVIDGASVGKADVADGYFSAFLDSQPGEEVSYVVTTSQGRTDIVSADEAAVSQPTTRSNDATRSCLSYLNITVAEPEPYGNRAQGNFDSAFDLIAEHTEANYVLAAATDGAEVTACLEAPSITWVATQADEMPAGALIAPLQPTIRPADSEPYPVVGRAADSVTEVEVVTSDGQRFTTHLEDGFYAVVLPDMPGTEVTYDVQTEEGAGR